MGLSPASPSPEVIGLLRDQVARNPGDLNSVLMLGSVLYQRGDAAGSAEVLDAALADHPDHLQLLLLLGRAKARSGDPGGALATFALAQQVKPEEPTGWQVGAALASELRNWAELLRIGRGWAQAQPGAAGAWQALARACFEESDFGQALTCFERVLELEPEKPEHLISAARMAIAAQQYELARHYLDRAQELNPDSIELQFAFSRWYHLTGDLESATACCERVLAARPDYAPALVELGILRQGRLADAEIDMVSRLFRDGRVHPENRVMLGFTLGDAWDSLARSEQAFAAWHQANEINRELSEQEGHAYLRHEFEEELDMLDALFAGSVPLPALPHTAVRPIFVLGMPRTGTTLVESILASHSRVFGGGELPALYDIHEELLRYARMNGINAARSLMVAKAASWRQRYLSTLPAHGDCDHVVDKQPLNFRSIGLIRMLFPDSPIFFLRRQAIDVGLSIYRHKFAKSWPCAHRLADIGHYYGIHERMFRYWLSRSGAFIHVVDYGHLVRDAEFVIRALLAASELDFESACLQPHKTRRRVATFSAVQVQNPLTTRYINRSAPYEPFLQPLRDELVRAGVEIS